MNTAIAQHLNVTESAILEVQEWARVLWVRVKGLGARFVSKKVTEMTEIKEYERQLSNGAWVDCDIEQYIDDILRQEPRVAKWEKRSPLTDKDEVINSLNNGSVLMWDTDWNDKIRVKPEPAPNPPIAEAPLMQTSTGEWVSPDEWDLIEGAM